MSNFQFVLQDLEQKRRPVDHPTIPLPIQSTDVAEVQQLDVVPNRMFLRVFIRVSPVEGLSEHPSRQVVRNRKAKVFTALFQGRYQWSMAIAINLELGHNISFNHTTRSGPGSESLIIADSVKLGLYCSYGEIIKVRCIVSWFAILVP